MSIEGLPPDIIIALTMSRFGDPKSQAEAQKRLAEYFAIHGTSVAASALQDRSDGTRVLDHTTPPGHESPRSPSRIKLK